MKFELILKFIFLFFTLTICTQNKIDTATICQKKLVQNFGLDALQFSREAKMPMCQKLKQSCCKETAQQQMYSNWIISGDSENVEKQFKFYFQTYYETLKIMQKTHKQAKVLLKKMQHQPTNNCKVMAHKITEFDVEKVSEDLENVMLDMYDFWYDSFEGIYCSVCSLSDQLQIDFELEKIYLSNNFCKSMVQKNITFLIYFKFYMVDFMNLIHEFLANCNHQGVYTEQELAEKAIITKDKYYPMLQQCFDEFTKKEEPNENSSEEEPEPYENRWYEYCSFICEKYQINRYNEFFTPRIKNYIEFDILMNQYLKKIQQEDADYQKMLQKTKYRLLEAQPERGVVEEDIKDQSIRRKLLLPYVYYRDSKKANMARLDLRQNIHTSEQRLMPKLEEFKLVFKDEDEEGGIDYFNRGQASLIIKKVYDFELSKELTANNKRPPDFVEVIQYKNQTIILKSSMIKIISSILSILLI